jgi:NPCBM-associated, NEW3 domain of alpha-galactosidase
MRFGRVSGKLLFLGALLTSFALPAFASFQVTSATATPTTLARGKPVALTASVHSSAAASNMVVDLEIHDPKGNKIAASFHTGVTFTAGQSHKYSWTYTLPANATAGSYTLRLGVFTANWASVSYWDNSAAAFTVTAPTNGVCGAVNGQALASAPTSNLCSAGTAGAVSGAGPWHWSCAGSNGGTTASCSASPANSGGTHGAVPAGLPSTLFVGLSMHLGAEATWVKNSGVPWSVCYQYISSGVQPDRSWVTAWGTNFAYNYAVNARGLGCIPEFTYYQIVPTGGEGSQAETATLKNVTLMSDYYKDFTALLKQLHSFGGAVLVHVEPDMFGYLQQVNANPAAISAVVASSGNADLAGLPNTLAGFGQALIHLRELYAPNVIIAAHVSTWTWSLSTDSTLNITQLAKNDAAFMTGTGNWDLYFTDIADHDSGYYEAVQHDNSHWWDAGNQKLPNFNRLNTWASAFTSAAQKRLVIWQLPTGNTIMDTMNNSNYHYQDNRQEYWLQNYPNNHTLNALAQAGVIGLMFGTGTSSNYDIAGDGITNPSPIDGNTRVSTYADDDGGLLRLNVGAYYKSGATPLP